MRAFLGFLAAVSLVACGSGPQPQSQATAPAPQAELPAFCHETEPVEDDSAQLAQEAIQDREQDERLARLDGYCAEAMTMPTPSIMAKCDEVAKVKQDTRRLRLARAEQRVRLARDRAERNQQLQVKCAELARHMQERQQAYQPPQPSGAEQFGQALQHLGGGLGDGRNITPPARNNGTTCRVIGNGRWMQCDDGTQCRRIGNSITCD